jgi:DNA-directed RNA polymerase sigma subunit (sigma70/sigma32)
METKPQTKKAHNIRDQVDHQQCRLNEITKDLDYLVSLVAVARRQVKKEKDVLASLKNKLQTQMQKDEIASNKVVWGGVYAEMLDDGFTPKEVAAFQNKDCKLKEIGEILGVSQSRAGEILRVALRKMRYHKMVQRYVDLGMIELD